MVFKKKETINKIETIIAEGTEVKGDIISNGTIRIDGIVDGHILKATGTIIGKGAKLKGNINADAIAVSGEVSGNITAVNDIELLSMARVYGDITTQSLLIKEGAVFEGKCSMVNTKSSSNEQKAFQDTTKKKTDN